jgi:hypothetical protein
MYTQYSTQVSKECRVLILLGNISRCKRPIAIVRPHLCLLQGLAGGTLLYITFFEVLSRDKLVKYGMTGFLGTYLVTTNYRNCPRLHS